MVECLGAINADVEEVSTGRVRCDTAIEYGLIAALISVVIITAITTVGGNLFVAGVRVVLHVRQTGQQRGFKPSQTMYLPVALAAATGVRRNELLAFRWTDLDVEKKTIKVERAWENTDKYGLSLIEEKKRHQRIMAGVPDGADVDLSLIALPPTSLVFPASSEAGEDFDFAKPRNPRAFSKVFARRAERIGFGRIRFHDLRGIHATALLDAGIPPHTVAQRIGDDPTTVLRNYVKRRRSKAANESVVSAITTIASGFLGK